MNGHAQGFCLVTQKLEPLFTASKTPLKKCCFHCYGHTLGFLHQTQKNHPVQHKQYHRKLLLSSFFLDGHT